MFQSGNEAQQSLSNCVFKLFVVVFFGIIFMAHESAHYILGLTVEGMRQYCDFVCKIHEDSPFVDGSGDLRAL